MAIYVLCSWIVGQCLQQQSCLLCYICLAFDLPISCTFQYNISVHVDHHGAETRQEKKKKLPHRLHKRAKRSQTKQEPRKQLWTIELQICKDQHNWMLRKTKRVNSRHDAARTYRRLFYTNQPNASKNRKAGRKRTKRTKWKRWQSSRLKAVH